MKIKLLLFILLSSVVLAQSKYENLILEDFYGMNKYSFKRNYSDKISDVYLAYDEKDNIQRAAAVRRFRSYTLITAILVIEKLTEGYMIRNVIIPDIYKVKERRKSKKLLRSINKYMLKDFLDAEEGHVDVVSGATVYHSALYTTLNLLLDTIVKEIEKNPGWKKIPLDIY